MKILIVLLLTLTGCSQDTTEIPRKQLDWANEVCENNGGIESMNPVGNPEMLYSRCNNGAEFEYSESEHK